LLLLSLFFRRTQDLVLIRAHEHWLTRRRGGRGRFEQEVTQGAEGASLDFLCCLCLLLFESLLPSYSGSGLDPHLRVPAHAEARKTRRF
jgi:hypothetical protein